MNLFLKRYLNRLKWITASLLLMPLTGCHGWQKSHLAAIHQYREGQIVESQIQLRKSLESPRAEKHVLQLDQAMIELASGRPDNAESRLRTIRRELDHLTQTDGLEQTTSMLTDDRALAFSGRPFERQMALNLLLLTSLVTNGQDSYAYAMQASEQAGIQKQLLAGNAQKHKDTASGAVPVQDPFIGPQLETGGTVVPAAFEHSDPRTLKLAPSPADQTHAMSAYLSAAVQSEIPTRYQETDQALSDLGVWNSAFAEEATPGRDGEFGTRCQQGHGTLHIIVLAGQAPEWVSESAMPTTVSLLIADRILSVAGKHTLPPTIAPVQISRPQPRSPGVRTELLKCHTALAEIPQAPKNSLTFHTLVDVNAAAEYTYQENRDNEIARAVTRRVAKKGAVYVLKEVQHIHNNTVVDLAVNVAGIAWEAMERADTRSWRLLPARIDVARRELPAGRWSTSLKIASTPGRGGNCVFPVHVESGRNTYVVCFIPGNSFAGNILIGGADQGIIPISDIHSNP
jgi:hypothetical protein